MDAWDGWELGRGVVAFSGLMYLGVWVQVSLMHRAGAFKHPMMYAPVLATPVVVGGAAAGAVARHGPWGPVALALLGLGAVAGLVGAYLHVRGVRAQIGGLTMRNLLAGPPPLLPVAYSLIGILGVMGLLWDA